LYSLVGGSVLALRDVKGDRKRSEKMMALK